MSIGVGLPPRGLIRVTEVRVGISQIVNFFSWQFQEIVTLSLVAQFVLAANVKEKCGAGNRGDPDQCQTDTESNGISWSLIVEEDVAGDKTAGVTDTNLHSRRDGPLVMTT